jgi:sporulation protein YlmC with PRC-barrel domain
MNTTRTSRRISIATLAVPALIVAASSSLAAYAVPQKEAAGATAHQTQAAAQRDFRGSRLIGREIRENGVTLGTIRDLVINMDTGDVRYAILSLQGDIAPGESRLYAIPTKAISMRGKNDELTLNIPASRWREKSFTASTWPSLHNSGYWDEVERLSGYPAVQPAEAYYAFRASELIGKQVNNFDGTKLGTLRDIVVDMNRQNVHYAVLDFSPGATHTGKLFRFPVTAFSFREANTGALETSRPLMLDVKPADLKAMKSFDAKNWPDLNEPGHLAKTSRYLKASALKPAKG